MFIVGLLALYRIFNSNLVSLSGSSPFVSKSECECSELLWNETEEATDQANPNATAPIAPSTLRKVQPQGPDWQRSEWCSAGQGIASDCRRDN
jgi:hypothetical protein